MVQKFTFVVLTTALAWYQQFREFTHLQSLYDTPNQTCVKYLPTVPEFDIRQHNRSKIVWFHLLKAVVLRRTPNQSCHALHNEQ